MHPFRHPRELVFSCPRHTYWWWPYRKANAEGSPGLLKRMDNGFLRTGGSLLGGGSLPGPCFCRWAMQYYDYGSTVNSAEDLPDPTKKACNPELGQNLLRLAWTASRSGPASDRAALQLRFWCSKEERACHLSMGRNKVLGRKRMTEWEKEDCVLQLKNRRWLERV